MRGFREEYEFLEHHLHLTAQRIDGNPGGDADRIAVEHELASIGLEEMQQQPGKSGFAAAGFADDAQGLAFTHGKRDAVHRLDRLPTAALHREMFAQIARNQHRLH